jgi:hypothetical protein
MSKKCNKYVIKKENEEPEKCNNKAIYICSSFDDHKRYKDLYICKSCSETCQNKEHKLKLIEENENNIKNLIEKNQILENKVGQLSEMVTILNKKYEILLDYCKNKNKDNNEESNLIFFKNKIKILKKQRKKFWK